MVKWLALLLAVALAACYFLLFEPQRVELGALREELAREREARLAAERDVRISAQEASSLNSRVAELEGPLAALRQTSAQLEAAVAEKEAQLAEVRESQDALVAELEEEIAQGQVQVQRLAERFPSNWELSAARAVNVARFLQEDAGVDPTLLSATGFSEFQPRSPNDTPEGRQRNRRIEILLGPHAQP